MQDVVLDACCLINLYAAGKILVSGADRPKPSKRKDASVSPAKKSPLDFRLHLPAKVKGEVQYILQPDAEDSDKLVKVEIDLESHIRAGLLHECDLEGEAELAAFVHMAVKLDDGEAACLAIAKCRSWLLATDERPTERLAKQHGVTIITTPELVKRWAAKTKASDEEIASVLGNIQTYAHYFPRKTLPLHSWWMKLVKKARAD